MATKTSCNKPNSGEQLLSRKELQGLMEIYDYRLMLVERFYERHLKGEYSYETFVKEVLPKWKRKKIIQVVQHGQRFGLILGINGVERVRKAKGLPDNILNKKGQVLYRYYYRPSELEPDGDKLGRYIYYSEFIFEMMELLDRYQLKYQYKDRLHMEQRLKFAQSDGVFIIEGTYEIHLHWNLKLAKEAKQQVQQAYAAYFSLYPDLECERQTYAVFLHGEEFGWLAYRQYHYNALEPYLNRSFNALALMPEEFKTWIKTSLIPKLQLTDPWASTFETVSTREGYVLNRIQKANPLELNWYHGYLRQGEGERLLLIDARDYSSTALKLMKWHASHQSTLGIINPYRKGMYAIVVTDNEEKMKEWLYQEELLGDHSLCFTTLDQLRAQPLLDACHYYNSQGEPTPLRKWM